LLTFEKSHGERRGDEKTGRKRGKKKKKSQLRIGK